jgi:hypothetical protein
MCRRGETGARRHGPPPPPPLQAHLLRYNVPPSLQLPWVMVPLHLRCERVAAGGGLPPPPLSRGGGEPSQWSSELPTMALCCGVVVALPCAARERGGRVN